MDRVGVLLVPLALVAACGADPGAPSSSHQSAAAIVVVVDGVLWELPAAACVAATGDLAAAAEAEAAEVERLVADRVSGWPTTTSPAPGGSATFYVALNRAGPRALALGLLSGTAADITAGWAAFESSYGGESWEPIDAISIRLAGWEATAAAIVAVVPAACG